MSITAVIDLELDNVADAVKAREVIEKYKGDASVSFDIMSKKSTLIGNNFDVVEIVDKLNKKKRWNFFQKKKKRWNATLESFTCADYSQDDAQESQDDAQQSQGDARALLQEPGHNGYDYNNYYNPGHNGYGYNNYYNPGHNGYGYNNYYNTGHNGYGYNNYYNLGHNGYGYNNYYNPGYSTQTQYQAGYHNDNSNPNACVIS